MSGTKVIGKATTAEVVNEAMRRLSLAVNPCKVCQEYVSVKVMVMNVLTVAFFMLRSLRRGKI